jgi:hypothetical protein
MESITDNEPGRLGWFDKNGEEIAAKCNTLVGSVAFFGPGTQLGYVFIFPVQPI